VANADMALTAVAVNITRAVQLWTQVSLIRLQLLAILFKVPFADVTFK